MYDVYVVLKDGESWEANGLSKKQAKLSKRSFGLGLFGFWVVRASTGKHYIRKSTIRAIEIIKEEEID